MIGVNFCLKQCTKCKQRLSLTEFNKDKSRKDGLQCWCKGCLKQYRQTHKEERAGYDKNWAKANPEKVAKKQKKWLEKNPEYIKEYHKQYNKTYRKTHKKEELQRARKWVKNNPEKVAEKNKKWQENNPGYTNQYMKNKYKTDLKFNLNIRMGTAIRHSLKNNKNGRRWEDLVGYTVEALEKHLRKTMPKGHTWQDFLDGKLHIDHVVPKDYFHYTVSKNKEFKMCWALENLQLLTKEENLKKNNILPENYKEVLCIISEKQF